MNILVISAHPDDETLGCGGTIFRHLGEGDAFHWLVLTEPIGPRWTPEIVAQKTEQLERVAAAYGAAEVIRAHLPAGELDTIGFGSVMTPIRESVERATPEVVYVVHCGDVHTDHSIAARAAVSVLKPFHMRSFGVRQMLAYETPSSTEAAGSPSFSPNYYVDITETLERKLEVMELYETELQGDLLPRNASAIRALARFRGATVATEYAEAFELIHEIH
jgi:LmbE family N-acetylglucosaminyl deacetylase